MKYLEAFFDDINKECKGSCKVDWQGIEGICLMSVYFARPRDLDFQKCKNMGRLEIFETKMGNLVYYTKCLYRNKKGKNNK